MNNINNTNSPLGTNRPIIRLSKYIGSFDGGDVTPHKRYEIHSFHVDESRNIFIGHCHSLLNAKDTVMSLPIVKFNN